MSFLAVALALLIEQIKPLPPNNWVHAALAGWVRWAGNNFNAGREHHATIVWLVSVPAPALLAWAIHAALAQIGMPVALVWDVLILYLTLGFRQFSHYFTDIQQAFDRADEARARELLREWSALDVSDLPREELLRHVIEQALLAAHRHVFGVFFVFIAASAIGLGPAGAVLYRLAHYAAVHWARQTKRASLPQEDRLELISRRCFHAIDYFPARLTAGGFAVVGNFEEAVNGMRRDAALWGGSNEGVLLAAAAGAVGVRLGGTAQHGTSSDSTGPGGARPDFEAPLAAGSTPGVVPQPAHLRSMVGLVWRSVVLWLLLLALLSLANLVG